MSNYAVVRKSGRENDLQYTRQAITENNAKPDFLFPGTAEYHDETFPQARLSMLGVKTTCKDRWRQVLSEAKRIKEKHLFTLEPAISTNQTSEMNAHHVRLVLPAGLHNYVHCSTGGRTTGIAGIYWAYKGAPES